MDYKGPIYYVHVAIDAFSKFASVDITKSTSGEILLPILDKLWSTHGVCEQIITDNGPPYSSTDFTKYCKRMGIHHNPTAPQHPQGNGLAENFMKKIAKVVHTATLEKRDPRREVFKMVLTHNATTHTTTNTPPAQALMNRPIRTLLPTINSPPTQQQTYIKERILQAKAKNKEYHDKHHHTKQKEVNLGDTVLISHNTAKNNHKNPMEPHRVHYHSKARQTHNNQPSTGRHQR